MVRDTNQLHNTPCANFALIHTISYNLSYAFDLSLASSQSLPQIRPSFSVHNLQTEGDSHTPLPTWAEFSFLLVFNL